MLVKFVPTGEIVDTAKVTPYKVEASAPAYAIPVLSSPYGGTLTSGPVHGSASAGQCRIYWKTASNAVSATWAFATEEAVDTALDAIVAGIAGDDAIVEIESTGVGS
jgi:hypothetical protein